MKALESINEAHENEVVAEIKRNAGEAFFFKADASKPDHQVLIG